MRKRSKYRPKPQLANPVAHVVQGFMPMAAAEDAMASLKIKNHLALSLLQQGQASQQDMKSLRTAFRIGIELSKLGIGEDCEPDLQAGLQAVEQAERRGGATGPELTSVNLAMEIHDAQLGVTLINELETAIERLLK